MQHARIHLRATSMPASRTDPPGRSAEGAVECLVCAVAVAFHTSRPAKNTTPAEQDTSSAPCRPNRPESRRLAKGSRGVIDLVVSSRRFIPTWITPACCGQVTALHQTRDAWHSVRPPSVTHRREPEAWRIVRSSIDARAPTRNLAVRISAAWRIVAGRMPRTPRTPGVPHQSPVEQIARRYDIGRLSDSRWSRLTVWTA